ncbi:MAG: hypothetical protein E3J90_05825 [Promethearchaeota archaeon]|nr:MAG: hypothetical protein E3J90_05825 [Candidatus Lokiarchaeota archaeon]
MSSIFYKVIFEGTKEDSSGTYSLTFKDIFSNNQIQISSQFFSTLRLASQKESNVVHFQNIKEVIKIGNPSIKIEINYYKVILYTFLNDGKKEGLLIGNIKNMGDMLIGKWPYNEELVSDSKDLYLGKLDLLTNSSKFDNISVINHLK